ncbi:MAG: acetyl-CoA carboxylase biotin carboxyl carrier protein subunit [Porphyromonadaceae bacterium]|nr:acetyl-CoA carboxylase biotin carboxyl carrier protein subunit [Porphyromonadaceae bacterium]MCD8288054.1 acetyl-CoA carboxylase biotin carboxyl carrier protein subunit [Porphyromonadaceae bacterium]
MKEFKYKINGNPYTVDIAQIEDNIVTLEVNGTPYKVELDKPAKKQIKPLTRPQAAPVTPAGTPVVTRPTASTVAGAVCSPLPGVILEMSVSVGDTVKRGQKVAILEAMKMENVIAATQDGKITAVKVNKGDSVLEGAEIVVIG